MTTNHEARARELLDAETDGKRGQSFGLVLKADALRAITAALTARDAELRAMVDRITEMRGDAEARDDEITVAYADELLALIGKENE